MLPDVDVVVLHMLLSSEGGLSTETVGATPLSSVDVIVKVFVVPIVTVCVVVGRPKISGGSLSGSAI